MNTPLLQLENIRLELENFSLLDVSLDLLPGEVHVIMGENRSGKSLLMQVISGIVPPDSGKISLNGLEIKSKAHKASYGDILYIRQDADIMPNLTIAENMFFNNLPYKNNLMKQIDYDRLNYTCQLLINELKLPFSIHDKVSSLGLAQRQFIEFCRAYISNARVIILDEPFASLTIYERQLLHSVVRKIQAKGTGIFYITHRLEDVFLLGNRISIIRRGRVLATKAVADCTEEEIIKLMSGQYLKDRYPKIDKQIGKIILSIKNLCFEDKLENISFDLHKGEILGITGLAGSGRSLLASCLFGATRNVKGTFQINGVPVKIHDPYTAIANGIALIPENRITDSIFGYMNIQDNVSVSALKRFANSLMINSSIMMDAVRNYIDKLNISLHQENSILNYSGGDQQKAVFAKWMLSRAKIFILDEPTRGLDIASKIDIYNYINDLIKKDVGILFISSDIEEILGICDRVAVLSDRTFVCDVPTKNITAEKIIELATKEA